MARKEPLDTLAARGARRSAYRTVQRTQRPSSQRRARRLTALACFASLALCVVVGALLMMRGAEYRAAQEEYAAIQATYSAQDAATELPIPTAPPKEVAIVTPMPEPAVTPFYSAKVARLKKENRHTVGWLDIPGTDIQYPIVQGVDNEFYMTHTFQKKKNASGAIFVDCWNAPDFTDFNTVIYGHNMKDGSMFAGLRDYRYQKFFNEHSFIEVTLLNKKMRYRVFAAYISEGDGGADFRGQNCMTELDRSTYILSARKRSTDIQSDYAVSRNDRLLTLATCTGGTHPWFWVLHAVLVKEEL